MKKKMFFLIIFFIILMTTLKELKFVGEKVKEQQYKNEMSNKAKIYSMLGMKKIGAGLNLLKQTANIGETLEKDKSIDIKKSSLEVMELNPYLLENYYFSANVLAFVKKYSDYEGAMEILNRGLIYNPQDKFLNRYLAGMVATSKGDNDEILKNYEEIIKIYPDPLMIKVVYNIYREKAQEEKKYLKIFLYYAQMLYEEEKYKEIIERDLKEIGLEKKYDKFF